MCGIVYVHQNKDVGRASKRAFKLYLAQKTRGQRGYGCITANKNKIESIYRSQFESGIEKIKSSKADMVLFHHRTPTSTPNLDECTHPIHVSHDTLNFDYYVIHNGMISNASTLKTKFETLGYRYTTEVETVYRTKKKVYDEVTKTEFNDTESFAIDLAIAIEGDKAKVESTGSIAFVALQVSKDTQDIVSVFYGRNHRNPLKLFQSDKEFILSSEGLGVEVEPHKLFCYNPKTKKITSRDLDIDSYVIPSASNYSGQQRKLDWDGLGREPMGFVHHLNRKRTKEQKKDKKKLVLSSVTIYGNGGDKQTIEFFVKGDYIYRTGILACDADKFYRGDWIWYKRIMRDMDRITDQLKEESTQKLPTFKQELIRQVKNKAQEFEHITEAINKRAAPSKDSKEAITSIEE